LKPISPNQLFVFSHALPSLFLLICIQRPQSGEVRTVEAGITGEQSVGIGRRVRPNDEIAGHVLARYYDASALGAVDAG
jgi:hypothetical protein